MAARDWMWTGVWGWTASPLAVATAPTAGACVRARRARRTARGQLRCAARHMQMQMQGAKSSHRTPLLRNRQGKEADRGAVQHGF